MELEILKLIYDYSIKGKLVDLIFVDKLIGIVVSKKSLNDYVRKFRYTNKLDKNDFDVLCASYNPLTNEILLDSESIQILLDRRSYYDSLFSSLEQIMFRNLTITQIVLHELEHAYQNKQADDKKNNSIETRLIRASFVLQQALKNPKFLNLIFGGEIPEKDMIIYILQNRELYNQYYSLNPTERLAEINSLRTIVNSIESIKEYIPALYEFKNATLVENMLRGYQDSWDQGTCPTEVYLTGTRQGRVWKEFDFYDQDSSQLIKNVSCQYNLNRRLSLGLPINYNEYSELNDWLQSTNKFNI